MVNKSIDGRVLKDMIIGGGQCLSISKNLIDAMNVFPVPDGDTGTNMTMTYMTAVNEVKGVEQDSVELILKAFTKGALKGARGNSGVILSQIIKGFSEVLVDKETISTKDFSKALKRGTEIAYSAVTKPKEGTMLTVIRVIAENSVRASLSSNYDDFFTKLIIKGEEILAMTPDMLPVLKKAGTVDAGGKGVLEIIRGMYNALAGIEMEEISESAPAPAYTPDSFQMPDYTELGEIEFGYCTEFMVVNCKEETTLADIDKLRDKLLTMGDSVLCIGDLSLVKVHIHTNNPGGALQEAVKLGEIDKIKIENMREQNRQLLAERAANVKDLALISICNGDGIKGIFADLGIDYVIDGGQTMNPSVDDILSMIKKANARELIIFPNNKNIILAAEQAKKLSDIKVYIVPTVNILQGIRAALSYDPNQDGEFNYDAMLSVFKDIKYGEITHAIKSTNIDDIAINSGDIIGLDGKHILCKGDSIDNAIVKLLEKLKAEENDLISLYYGNGVTEEQAMAIVDKIGKIYPDAEITCNYGGQQHYYYFISLE